MPKKRAEVHPVAKLTDIEIEHVDALLFFGSIFSSKSLMQLLKEYKEKGPYHPVRHALMDHLVRTLQAMGTMEGCILARMRLLDDPAVKRQFERSRKKQERKRREGS